MKAWPVMSRIEGEAELLELREGEGVCGVCVFSRKKSVCMGTSSAASIGVHTVLLLQQNW